MSDWLHHLPVPLMAVVIFGFAYLHAGVVFAAVRVIATEERTKSFKSISPGMLPVNSIIFGLFVAVAAAQVWNDVDRASAAVTREASALRSTVLLSAGLPEEQQTRLRGLLRDYLQQATAVEWPDMARRAVSLRTSPPALDGALQFVASLTPQGAGQQTAQREIVDALQIALDARRQRIIASHAEVDPIKWLCIYLQATCALFVIGLIHCDNRLAAGIAMGLFATSVAAAVLLITAHDRPFAGYVSVSPEPLLQVMPDAQASR